MRQIWVFRQSRATASNTGSHFPPATLACLDQQAGVSHHMGSLLSTTVCLFTSELDRVDMLSDCVPKCLTQDFSAACSRVLTPVQLLVLYQIPLVFVLFNRPFRVSQVRLQQDINGRQRSMCSQSANAT